MAMFTTIGGQYSAGKKRRGILILRHSETFLGDISNNTHDHSIEIR